MARLTKAQLRQKAETDYHLRWDNLQAARTSDDVVAEQEAIAKIVFNYTHFPAYTEVVSEDTFNDYKLLLERLTPLATAERLERAWRSLPGRLLSLWTDLVEPISAYADQLRHDIANDTSSLLYMLGGKDDLFKIAARADLCKKIVGWHSDVERKDCSAQKKIRQTL